MTQASIFKKPGEYYRIRHREVFYNIAVLHLWSKTLKNVCEGVLFYCRPPTSLKLNPFTKVFAKVIPQNIFGHRRIALHPSKPLTRFIQKQINEVMHP